MLASRMCRSIAALQPRIARMSAEPCRNRTRCSVGRGRKDCRGSTDFQLRCRTTRTCPRQEKCRRRFLDLRSCRRVVRSYSTPRQAARSQCTASRQGRSCSRANMCRGRSSAVPARRTAVRTFAWQCRSKVLRLLCIMTPCSIALRARCRSHRCRSEDFLKCRNRVLRRDRDCPGSTNRLRPCRKGRMSRGWLMRDS